MTMNIVRDGKTRGCYANQHHGRDDEGPEEDEDRGHRDNCVDDNDLGVDLPVC